MTPPNTIAIDGPAASGKSTIAELLAKKLGYLFFDTGIMYRAVTWYALDRQVSIDNEEAITSLAEQIDIDVCGPTIDDGRKYDVSVDSKDITWEIRSPEVERYVSQVSAYCGVRTAMTQQQRKIAQRGQVVMVGRDIGTVVLPEADLKIYLDASVEERARRRYEEVVSRGESADLNAILAGMRRRDQIDSTRAIAPLRPAEDAVIIDSDQLSINEVLEKVLSLF